MADFPKPGESVGRYTIGERLGQGGSGTVFRATRSLPRREVALKVIPSSVAAAPGFRAHFLHEADVLTDLNSPHIVSIHDVGEEDGFLYIATDLVSGGDLATRLSRGPVALEPALTLVAQVAQALSAAHRTGIVHGDVKPTNVLLSQRDSQVHAYLCDFGVAQPEGAGGTRRSVVTGAYPYLAPELITGGAASASSDIYALGCVLVAAITGQAPYQGTDQEIAQQHLTSEIPRWEETSPVLAHLNELVRTSLAKDPGDRYPSAAAFRDAILAVIGEVRAMTAALEEPAETEPEPVPEPGAEPEPDESAEETQVRMAAITAPVYSPDQGDPPSAETTAPKPEQPKRDWLLILSLTALVLVGAAIALIVLLQQDDDPRALTGASTRPSASPEAPTSSPTAPSARTCPDGREVEADQRCGNPSGTDGLRVVFTNISGDCTDSTLNTVTKKWEIACERGGANPATVTYTTYRTVAIGREVNNELFPDSQPIRLPSGLSQFGPTQTPSGRWQIALAYAENHPFGVLIVADSRDRVLQIADTAEAGALPPDKFEGE